jgi:predicted lactoylglutathione lyase
MSDWPPLLDHVGLPVSRLDRSAAFYAAALRPLGVSLLGQSDAHVALGIGHMPYLLLRPVRTAPASVHLAFTATARSQVDDFYAAAIGAGGADNGAPGLRPAYHANYYGAFVLDPDGHNIEVVMHDPV